MEVVVEVVYVCVFVFGCVGYWDVLGVMCVVLVVVVVGWVIVDEVVGEYEVDCVGCYGCVGVDEDGFVGWCGGVGEVIVECGDEGGE